MMARLVEMYRMGALTAHHLAVECLQMIDPDDPALVLDPLPEEVLAQVLDFAREYRPGRMRSSWGVPPAADQVEAARRWIEGRRKLVASRPGLDRSGE